ncbi:MAG: hypothetical protein GXP62_07615 [Oligoflexia bacterium]|nr:hypothetical protein [Oligoflexia bacterium]
MDEKKKLVSVAGLRKADPTTLQVLTQDVLRTPLVRIEPATLVDLLALSELGEDQVPGAMVKELSSFQRQMFRELADLPDGIALASFAADLCGLRAETLPTCLRDAVAEILPDRKDADAVNALQALIDHASTAQPEAISLPAMAAADSPNKSAVTKVKPAKKRASRKAKSAEAKLLEEERGQWIEGDVIVRLAQYNTGLKEAIMVAGSRHRAPWDDVTEKEVLKVLRRLKREERLRFSAGRWYVNK